ncbi:hypothetical protein WMY93_026904 [Mugilogobius chulae]|uniref:Ig-like domain-containing protein n=1 Tax=Mugilogobius chulae TaxID=88201 RepID=A0AAW0N9W5_9GOBI
MKTLLVALVIALVHCSNAELIIRGPTEPVLAWRPFKVECLLNSSEYTINDVRMEHFYNEWRNVTVDKKGPRCFRPMTAVRGEDKLTLEILFLAPMQGGLYRCVLDGPNVTTPEYTETLNFTVHYLYMSRPQYTRNGKRAGRCMLPPSEIVPVQVQPGDNVEVTCSVSSSENPDIFWYKEGDDWILPSSVLRLESVNAQDEGLYTCNAEHPPSPPSARTSLSELF